jgi:serine/threonine protein kinase/Tfp pilus assembly protein PilF
MTPERWRKVDELLQEAIQLSPSECAPFLAQVCPDDDTRREIESLVSFHKQSGNFLEIPAFETAASLFCDPQNNLVGLLIGTYQIETQLGAGGMGVVYLAEDTKLGRKVALKSLAPYAEGDDFAKKRLVKEARAAARLDHQNICTIYEVIEEAGQTFIVMQYVEGETLATRNQRAALDVTQSLDVAVKVADALAEAHSQGIIHRDIKPQNIMITSRGQVKVLDFGLSTIVRPNGVPADTQTQLSAPGIVVGTAAYMSPEQVRGDCVDARSDLFSLGAVLYECVNGRSPFCGATAMEICAQVIYVDPPLTSHSNPHLPPALDAVMAKDPSRRYQSAAEMIDALRSVQSSLQSEHFTSAKRHKPKLIRLAAHRLTNLVALARQRNLLTLAALAMLSVALFVTLRGFSGRPAASYQPAADALRWYNVGMNALRNGTYYDATIALQQAIAVDDKFPLAHAVLAEAWMELGYSDKANHELLRARSLIHDLSPLPRSEALYLQAITHVVLREFAPAVANYQQILIEAPESEKARAYVDLGGAYERNNEVDKALESYSEAARLAPTDVTAFLRLGILYTERGQDMPKAVEAFNRAEDIYYALRNYEGITEVCYQRATLFYNQYRPSDARAQLEKAIEITKTTGNYYQQVRAQALLSNVIDAQGDANQAELTAKLAIETARANSITNQVTSGMIWLGNTFLTHGKYAEAESSYQQGLDLAQRDKDELNEAWAMRSLGSLRMQQGKTEDGLRYLEPARRFFERGSYRKWLSLTLILIGRAYRDSGDYAMAVENFKDLLVRAEQAKDDSQAAFAHSEIGSVLALQEQYSEALKQFDAGYDINKSLNAPFSIGYSLLYRSGILWRIGRYGEARTALEESSSIAMSSSVTYKPLLASVDLVNASMQLSECRLLEAKKSSRKALDSALSEDPATIIQATFTLGLAQTRSGALRAGMLLCDRAVEMSLKAGDGQLLAAAWLASAEASLEANHAQRALEMALQAQRSFERSQQQDSEWRAWLIAARASQILGEQSASRDYASKAELRLAELEQRWTLEIFNSYRSRPDVKRCQAQLEQILTSNHS